MRKSKAEKDIFKERYRIRFLSNSKAIKNINTRISTLLINIRINVDML